MTNINISNHFFFFVWKTSLMKYLNWIWNTVPVSNCTFITSNNAVAITYSSKKFKQLQEVQTTLFYISTKQSQTVRQQHQKIYNELPSHLFSGWPLLWIYLLHILAASAYLAKSTVCQLLFKMSTAEPCQCLPTWRHQLLLKLYCFTHKSCNTGKTDFLHAMHTFFTSLVQFSAW